MRIKLMMKAGPQERALFEFTVRANSIVGRFDPPLHGLTDQLGR
jgi:hypothetical protein